MNWLKLIYTVGILNIISTIKVDQEPKKYSYLYNCELTMYIRLGNGSPGKCISDDSHICSYESNENLGVIVTEERLIESKALPGSHRGCYH